MNTNHLLLVTNHPLTHYLISCSSCFSNVTYSYTVCVRMAIADCMQSYISCRSLKTKIADGPLHTLNYAQWWIMRYNAVQGRSTTNGSAANTMGRREGKQ